MKTEKLNKLKEECLNCKKCVLGDTRINIVFSDGNPETAKAILIGDNSLFLKVKQPFCKFMIIVSSGYKLLWYIKNKFIN